MSATRVLRLLALCLTCLMSPALLAPQAPSQPNNSLDITELERLFHTPPDDSRIMMRWWWFGPAVTKTELEREMREMKTAGVGGFEVQPVYPLILDDPANGIKTLPFLSDEFLDALKFTSEKARELGLRMDLTLGSGWPFGGPQVPVSHAAGQLRLQRVKVTSGSQRVSIPSIGAGEKLIAVFLAAVHEQSIAPESLHELAVGPDKVIELPAGLDAPHEVLFFIASRTGMMVKRPAVGAEGFVVDHYDRAAVAEYQNKVGDRLMQAFGDRPPYAVFCDSLEVFQSDWTGDLLEEFQKRRGYDLKPYLAALVFDIGPKTAPIRHDWGKTLTELFNERFARPMREWARQHGTLFRMQGYGMPPAELSSNALADLPEGEGPQWKVVRATRWASSASHIYGRPVSSSETWTWIHSPVFRATPLDLKAEADLHFLQGINQLIGHGWPYSPAGVEYPGWRFYASGALNEKNPWWIVMPDVSAYLQRLSFLLRQGEPVNDVALYLPNSDAWASFAAGRVHLIDTLRDRVGTEVMPQVLEAGFDLDFFDDDALSQVGRVENGVLALGPGKYRAVILPNVERIPLETLKKLAQFAQSGGVLIATRRLPALAPGFTASDGEQKQIRDITNSLFRGSSPLAHFVEDEKQLGKQMVRWLKSDISYSSPSPDLGFVHRRTKDAEIYFVANTGNTPVKTNASFRISANNAERWDPISDEVSKATVVSRSKEPTTISLNLEPYASTVIVFSRRSLPSRSLKGSAAASAPIDLSGDWKILFGQEPTSRNMNRIESWTEQRETRNFSGVATYSKDVVVPQNMLRPRLTVKLDFGDPKPLPIETLRAGMQASLESPVREAAVVYVNGARAGSVWAPPYALDITRLLKPGKNNLKIVVGNLAVNYMAGHALPDYRLLNLRYGVRFEVQDMDKIKPEPAGLLGPIRLVSVPESGQ